MGFTSRSQDETTATTSDRVPRGEQAQLRAECPRKLPGAADRLSQSRSRSAELASPIAAVAGSPRSARAGERSARRSAPARFSLPALQEPSGWPSGTGRIEGRRAGNKIHLPSKLSTINNSAAVVRVDALSARAFQSGAALASDGKRNRPQVTRVQSHFMKRPLTYRKLWQKPPPFLRSQRARPSRRAVRRTTFWSGEHEAQRSFSGVGWPLAGRATPARRPHQPFHPRPAPTRLPLRRGVKNSPRLQHPPPPPRHRREVPAPLLAAARLPGLLLGTQRGGNGPGKGFWEAPRMRQNARVLGKSTLTQPARR